MIDEGIEKGPLAEKSDLKKALDEVVKTTIAETKKSALESAGELTPRRLDLAEKRCRSIQPCGCAAATSQHPSPWRPQQSQVGAMFEYSTMNDREFWARFCESNTFPLGYLAGIRAMQVLNQRDELIKEIQLMKEAIEKMKFRDALIEHLVKAGATIESLKLVYSGHEAHFGRIW